MKVKITVKEFLDNKGVLKKGRDIFANWEHEPKIGTFLKIDSAKLFWINNNSKQSHPWDVAAALIEIEVTPIYK